ncbi:polysaccharide export outer membrane protein [Modicisalibacter ilicicola DSM 19980]|uniref:Polysaccharide export outer membrane protein n=1 Tax=Modicisalibacter ilicicola DSM 19980 TaxID=1121942 RepID=A0A1M5C074_9GAMM|nr:polysaccharide export protein [Halomonas ilicicola]SHF48194.1 polysaccharide export outer membrane protein [Halomonas ilicicola DSM 19980]
MKKITRISWLAIAVLSMSTLAGCAWAPGGHIDYDADAPPLDDRVEVQPITPEFIATYREQVNAVKATSMSTELSEAMDAYEYEVGPGDVLTIIVYDHPELTIPAGAERSAAESGTVVQSDGTIYYPYIGRVKVEDRTVDQIRRIIASRLSNFITDPQVEVSVAAFLSKKVYVTGAVGAPGVVPITNVPMTVLDVISQTGGTNELANLHGVTLNRNGEEQELSLYAMLKEGDLSQNRLVQPGDVLHVPTLENQNVAVLGQVLKPGNIPVGNERLSLTDALSRAGGVDEFRAEPSGIFVLRGMPAGSEKIATVYQLDISNAVSLTMGNYFQLQPQDVVYVTAAPLARWNKVISLLLPSLTLPGDIAGSGDL